MQGLDALAFYKFSVSRTPGIRETNSSLKWWSYKDLIKDEEETAHSFVHVTLYPNHRI